jgi:hypothetical protein
VHEAGFARENAFYNDRRYRDLRVKTSLDFRIEQALEQKFEKRKVERTNSMRKLQRWAVAGAILVFAHTSLADWQMTATTSVLGTQLPTTNLVVTKKAERRARVDILPTSGFLSAEDKAEQIHLDHQRRTLFL